MSNGRQRPTVVYLGLALADTALAAAGVDRPRWLTKPLLMPALMRASSVLVSCAVNVPPLVRWATRILIELLPISMTATEGNAFTG